VKDQETVLQYGSELPSKGARGKKTVIIVILRINSSGVWPNGCLIDPYYRRLSPDQVYSVERATKFRHSSLGAGNLRPPTSPPLDHIGYSVNTDGGEAESAPALS
jgi:hypothetical protein